MIEFLREAFEENFNELKMESRRSITPAMKEYAWQQVELYWMKLAEIARRITETEVHLILPNQQTPENRRYTIEGIVDIVQEEGKTIMYDIKTHKNTDVIAYKEKYTEQLNVYAHIWQNLRNTTLDQVAIIATAPPELIRRYLKDGEKEKFEEEMEKWNPLVELNFDQQQVVSCIQTFGETVDKIENGEFTAPPIEKLREIKPGQKAAFGTAVCRHCDARYSCSSYDIYINKKDKNKIATEVLKEIEIEDELEKEARLQSLLDE